MQTDAQILEGAYQKQIEIAYAAFVQAYIAARGDAQAIASAANKFGQAVRVQREIRAKAVGELPP